MRLLPCQSIRKDAPRAGCRLQTFDVPPGSPLTECSSGLTCITSASASTTKLSCTHDFRMDCACSITTWHLLLCLVQEVGSSAMTRLMLRPVSSSTSLASACLRDVVVIDIATRNLKDIRIIDLMCALFEQQTPGSLSQVR